MSDLHSALEPLSVGLVPLFVSLACTAVPPAVEPPAERSASLRTQCGLGVATACTQMGDIAYFDHASAAAPVRELWTRGCELGDPRACARMGTASLFGDAVRGSGREALTWYERGCVVNQPSNCTAVGALLVRRPYDDIETDYARAHSLFDDACARDHGPACHNLAWMYVQGLGMDPDPHRGLELFERSCELGYAPGCRGVGIVHWEGKITAPDLTAAAPYLQRACEYGDPLGCDDLGYLYSVQLDRPEDALRWRGRGCELANPSCCYALGYTFAKGYGVYVDEVRAAKYHERGCELGSSLSCFELAHLHGLGIEVDVEADELERMVARACVLGLASCNAVSGPRPNIAPERERTTSLVNADLPGGLATLEQACEQDDGLACELIARINLYGMVDAPDLAVAAQYFLRSCELDTATACTGLGRLHARFEGVGLERGQSAPWSLRGCELGDAHGCLDLAYDFSKGKAGVQRSDTLAAEYFERACELDRATCI